jgi:hypothetical protein
MVAIQTKYLCPTNYRGARVKAWREGGPSKVYAWDHALDIVENHASAARQFAEHMKWAGDWVGGSTDCGWAFVCVSRGDGAFNVKGAK